MSKQGKEFEDNDFDLSKVLKEQVLEQLEEDTLENQKEYESYETYSQQFQKTLGRSEKEETYNRNYETNGIKNNETNGIRNNETIDKRKKVTYDNSKNEIGTNEKKNKSIKGTTQESRNIISKKEWKRRRRRHRILKRLLILVLILAAFFGLLFGTKTGRRVFYQIAGSYIYKSLQHEDGTADTVQNDESAEIIGRQEEYVLNYLIFGIEEIEGARNTDSMMIASINSKDDTIKLTSLMRDSYVDIPGWKSTKLNAAYAHGGVDLLMKTIESNYKIHLDGYAYVNFESFEKIVDSVDGIDIKLGKVEARYLNRTNYISNPEYRNVKAGVNTLNGNQALGYSRVRKVETLGGANNDYGRTLRHRRIMNAFFKKFKSLSIFKQFFVAKECMGYVTTNLTEEQITQAIEVIMENKINNLKTIRIPADGMFDAPTEYQGVTYPIVLDWDKNIDKMYQFIYGD